jgi:hypothetical protein
MSKSSIKELTQTSELMKYVERECRGLFMNLTEDELGTIEE